MKKSWSLHIIALAALAVVFPILGQACAMGAAATYGQSPNNQSGGVASFPSGFIGTWERDNSITTLNFETSQLTASNQDFIWVLRRVSGNSYTISPQPDPSYMGTLNFRVVSGNLEISGDSGPDEHNWNGIWRKQSGTAGSAVSGQSAAASQPASQYWTGDGGRGMRLGILVPQSRGLSENQDYLPVMVQGVLVSDISQYSAISVMDRVSLDRVVAETLDPTYEEDWDIVSLGHVAQVGHMMTGSIIRTATGYSLQINVTDTTAQAKTVASYSGTCTAAELDDHSAIHRASSELLSQMNVRLTARARNELARASAPESINAQTALARGVTAQNRGSEVAALSYFLQAAEFDPSLQEAETRLASISAVITSGNMGADVRNDIQWRSQWVSRLRETEQFITQFMRENRNYYLIYSSSVTQGVVDYTRETITLSIELRSAPEPLPFETINKLTRTVRNGLLATGRAETWGINWPAQSITTPSPFFAASNTYPVIVELFNAAGKSVGRQTGSISLGGWFMPDGGALSGTTVPYLRTSSVKLDFAGVDVKDIDDITIRVISINGIPAERAATQMALTILPQDEYDNIPSIADNGLQLANLSLFDIRFDQGKNLLRGYQGSIYMAIPYGVSHIDSNSGLENKGLTSVKLPSSVTVIGDHAFYENLLISVSIPNSVTSIGRGAFYGNRLTSVIIPNSVTTIGGGAFSSNPLTSVFIPDSVSSIGGGAFDNRRGTILYTPYFDTFYNNNGRRAGLYTTRDGENWNYSPRR